MNYGGYMGVFAGRDILDPGVPEHIQLAQDLRDSVAEVPEALIPADDEKAEIDRRLDAYHKDPGTGFPWSVVRERIKSHA